MLLIINQWHKPKPIQIKNDKLKTLATIVAEENSSWLELPISKNIGIKLAEGTYHLTQGTVSLETNTGSILVIRAPAKFSLLPGEQLNLKNGELGVKVAENSSFRVNTENRSFIDLGTEFSLFVSPTHTRFYVFEGSVAVLNRENLRQQNKNRSIFKAKERT